MQKLATRILISFLLVLLSLITPPFVHAHILQSNGSVGAVMHVSPDDDPVAGTESDFFFEFKDKEGKFKPPDCNCIIRILQSGREIFTQELFTTNTDPSLSNASVSFTFPQKDVYKVQIVGKPKSQGSFTEFTLNYDIRVERISDKNISENQTTTSQSNTVNWLMTHIPHVFAGICAVLLLIIVVIKSAKKR